MTSKTGPINMIGYGTAVSERWSKAPITRTAFPGQREQKRIDFVPVDSQIRAYFDIGGTGARADEVSIRIAQFVGQINVLDYCEAQGQPLSVHLQWMRDRGWAKAWLILPHDGAAGDKVFAAS